MLDLRLPNRVLKFFIIVSALLLSPASWSQLGTGAEIDLDESTIRYPASWFTQYSPVSVNDMLSRIPGISSALRGRGGNRRGLGAGQNEILINGKRMAGKENRGKSQLSRIAASQLDYIEIIRGTSGDLNVRSGGLVVNIVLRASPSRSSVSAEVNMDHYADGTISPGGSISLTGQRGELNYLFSLEAEPRYNIGYRDETSYNPDYSLREIIDQEYTQDKTEYQGSMSLGYQFETSSVQFNALYAGADPNSETNRLITDYSTTPASVNVQREFTDREQSNWEIGGNYEYEFANRGSYKFLFIVNDETRLSTRERFKVEGSSEIKDLFLDSPRRTRERIARTSYSWSPWANQSVELGVEGAQTILDSDLRIGIAGDSALASPDYGDLVPVSISNAGSTVEEIRYESFAVHNWTINDRMSLESTLIFETSVIEQSGDVENQRDFDFIRPKLDYRFDITPSIQFRASVEKTVSQLSFSDFSASTDNSDDDQNTVAGNPELVQEQSWRYQMNMEYRLPENVGVISTSVFYHDLEDVIDRIDVSPEPSDLQSARGNIGDGKRYGIAFDVSSRLGFMGLPEALFSSGLVLQDSQVTDPFLGIGRRQSNNSRGFFRTSFRHDLTDWNLNYGINISHGFNGGSGRTRIDIDDIETETSEPQLSFFVEKRAFNGVTFRFESNNTLDSVRCRERIRYLGATANGIIEEIEDSCYGNGRKFALKIRSTF